MEHHARQMLCHRHRLVQSRQDLMRRLFRPMQQGSITGHFGIAGLNDIGRKPSFTGAHVQTVADMTTMQAGVSAIAAATGLSRQTVYRIQADPMAAVAMLTAWDAPA